MTVTLLLALLPLVQNPGSAGGPAPGEVGKFRWPPTVEQTLEYKAKFTKVRRLPADLLRAEKAARRAARLYVPSRPVQQRVEMSMDIELAVGGQTVEASYATTLGKQSLRLIVHRPERRRGEPVAAAVTPAKTVPFLGNDRIRRVWGVPSARGESKLEVPLAALERRFQQTFHTAGAKGTAPEDLRRKFGDHLLPVVWIHPLPCWLSDLVHTMELGGPGNSGAMRLEIGVRPEFVSFAEDGIPVEIVRLSDAGRYQIVDLRHGEHVIKLLVPEGAVLPSESIHVRFDPAHTRIYADGWMMG